jgi:hypothetical protein
MATNPTPIPGPVVNLRARSLITTILVALIAMLIVRDILARRWAAPLTAGRVTSRSSCDSERQPPSVHADA